ncbi:MAG: glyoxalase/bleomycin resistance/extradiol dioxygenase family protein [Spirosoma sp.]|nr:glyoxalase/bleomycin resistance/extradiol dioxygenase family protein [Spirosoma sp.]
MASPLLGLRTAIYAVPDLNRAKTWYAAFLGIAPYFDEPFYEGFNVGGYELGLDPTVTPALGMPITYWGVADLAGVCQSLVEQGTTVLEAPPHVRDGIELAILKDPFGNQLGLIENPHFKAES